MVNESMVDTVKIREELINFLREKNVGVFKWSWAREFDERTDENKNIIRDPKNTSTLVVSLVDLEKPIEEQAKEAVERGKDRKVGAEPNTRQGIDKKNLDSKLKEILHRFEEHDLWKSHLSLDYFALKQKYENLEKKVKELESRSPFYLTYTYTMPNYSQQTGSSEECLCDKCAYKNFPVTTNGYYPCYYCYWAKYKTRGGKQ